MTADPTHHVVDGNRLADVGDHRHEDDHITHDIEKGTVWCKLLLEGLQIQYRRERLRFKKYSKFQDRSIRQCYWIAYLIVVLEYEVLLIHAHIDNRFIYQREVCYRGSTLLDHLERIDPAVAFGIDAVLEVGICLVAH